MLRAIGAQIEATTNHEAMRDLSGRRQRDVNNEKKLVKYVEGAAERERLEREKREAKMEKLRMMAEGEVYNRDKHSFSDADYDKARSEVEEKIHDAMEAAMAAGGEKTLKEAGASSSGSGGGASCSGGGNLKRKQNGSEDKKGVEVKKVKGLWQDELDNLDDEDLSDSSDDDEEAKVKDAL